MPIKSYLLVLGFLFSLQTKAAESTVNSLYKTSAEIETACRIKAKEVAAEAYRGCVTEQKTSQIEQIKKEYAEKLNALKNQYEQELKKLSSQAQNKASTKASSASKNTKSSKKTAVVAPVVREKNIVQDKPAATEMTVELRATPGAPAVDESTLDLPEPIPVEEGMYN